MFIIKPAQKYYYFVYLLLSFFFINSVSYSQTDSLRRKTDSLSRIPFDTLKIKNTVQFSQQSDTIPYNDFIWNDKRNVSEILNEKSGFFVNSLGLGMYNRLYHNDFRDYEMGIFRDGIQLNNNFFGIFEPELISVNEIAKIELVSDISSFIYGMSSYGKAINIITKDTFSPKPFSQLRYSQDRYGSLFADASFTIPFSNKFNFLIRANNHSLDGKYVNSDFSAWRANGRMSWFPSAKWNYKLDFNYAKISRGINDGLDFREKDLSQDSIINILRDTKSPVIDGTGREESRNYLASLSAYSSALGSNSLASAQFYYSHYYRSFGGEAFSLSPVSPQINEYYYTGRLGLNLKYNKKIIMGSEQAFDITLLNNYYWNSFNIDYQPTDTTRATRKVRADYGFLSGKIDYTLDKFYFSALAKEEMGFVKNGIAYNAFSYGGEMKIKLFEKENNSLSIFAGANQIEYLNTYIFYPTFPIYQKYSYSSFESGLQYNSKNFNSSLTYNNSAEVSSAKFNFSASISQFVLKSESSFRVNGFNGPLPVFSKNDLSYSNKFFKNKLNLKIGFNFKFLLNFEEYRFSHMEGMTLRDYWEVSYSTSYSDLFNLYNQNNKLTADFYIGARIGHANINFTVANIFDSFYFDTFMYPELDRGGLGNAVSRFTIVWDFIN